MNGPSSSFWSIEISAVENRDSKMGEEGDAEFVVAAGATTGWYIGPGPILHFVIVKLYSQVTICNLRKVRIDFLIKMAPRFA